MTGFSSAAAVAVAAVSLSAGWCPKLPLQANTRFQGASGLYLCSDGPRGMIRVPDCAYDAGVGRECLADCWQSKQRTRPPKRPGWSRAKAATLGDTDFPQDAHVAPPPRV